MPPPRCCFVRKNKKSRRTAGSPAMRRQTIGLVRIGADLFVVKVQPSFFAPFHRPDFRAVFCGKRIKTNRQPLANQGLSDLSLLCHKGIPSVRICSGRASTSRVCSTSWDTPAPASPWMSTPTRTTTPSSTPLIRSQPTCDRIKTGHFPYTASYTICVETYPYLCRFTGDPNFGRTPQNPAKSLRQKGYGGLYTSAWAASKSPGRAGGMY